MPRTKKPALNPLIPDFRIIDTLTERGEMEFTVLLDSFPAQQGMNANALKHALARLKDQKRITMTRSKGRSFYQLAAPPSTTLSPRRTPMAVVPLTPQFMARAGIALSVAVARR